MIDQLENQLAEIRLPYILASNLAVAMTSHLDSVEQALKIILLAVSIGLTCLTIWFKWKRNGKDQ